MKAVAVVLSVLALLALGVDIEAKRIHQMRAALHAEDAVEADVVADADAEASLPFDGDYWTDGGRPELTKILASAAKGKPQNTAELLAKFFTADNILLAQQQGSTVTAAIGTYKAVAQTRSCNQGVCDDKWTPLDLQATTGTKTQGGEGIVRMTCTVPKDLATAKCTLEVFFGTANTVFFVCPDVGGAKPTCSVPTYQYASSTGSWYTSRFVTDVVDGADVYFNADSTTINWKWHGTYNNRLVFTGLIFYTSSYKTHKPTINPAQPGALPALTTAAKKPQLTTADLLKKFFTEDNIMLAQQQGANVYTTLGGYGSAAVTRTCNQGICSSWDKLDLLATTGTKTQGGEGVAKLQCTVPKDLTTAKCTLEVFFGTANTVMFVCPDVGGSGTKSCSVPTYQYASSTGSWYTSRFVTDVTEEFGVFFTADQTVIHWKWRGVYNTKLVGTDLTWFTTAPYKTYKPTINPPAPAPLPALVAAQKAKVLTTADLLEKFFTKDNIALAQMQGSSIPVRATIGAYKALSNSRTCNQGVCSEWTALDLLATTGTQTRGGEGSLALTCTVPKDLATAKCNLEAFIAGGSVVFFVCPDIGSGKATCSVPTYQYASSTGSWYTQRFVTDVTEFFGAYFTAEQLVINWKWRGVSNTKLVGTELTLYTTTPFVDFATPLKTNCLSKTTVDAVMKAASAKLKNKITLTTTAVDALIKSAPYTTVQQAIDKIKGIGPVNVVYVSFMWNFQC